MQLLRCARKGEPEWPVGRTTTGVLIQILQRMLTLTAALWHHDHTGQPV